MWTILFLQVFIECAGKTLRSSVIQRYKSNPNFTTLVDTIELVRRFFHEFTLCKETIPATLFFSSRRSYRRTSISTRHSASPLSTGGLLVAAHWLETTSSTTWWPLNTSLPQLSLPPHRRTRHLQSRTPQDLKKLMVMLRMENQVLQLLYSICYTFIYFFPSRFCVCCTF